jgi:hypothetical protein
MSAIMTAKASAYPASAPPSRGAEQMGKRARSLKLALSTRLSSKREALRLKQRDIHDRPRLVGDWEDPHARHSPTALHLAEQVSDPLSRPYALEVIAWVLELAEREEPNAAQLNLFDYAERNTTA